jgi:hypothetical protein
MTFANNCDCTGKKQQKKPKAREEGISGDDSMTEVGAECRKELGLDENDDEERKNGRSGRKTKRRKGEKQLEASSSEEEDRRRGKKKQKKVKNFIHKKKHFEWLKYELKGKQKQKLIFSLSLPSSKLRIF